MDKVKLTYLNRSLYSTYDINKLTTDAIKPIDCIVPGYFSGNDVLFVTATPGLLKEYVEADTFFKNSDVLRDYDEMDKTYVNSLRSQGGSLGVFVNDVMGRDWSNISITSIVKCPLFANKTPKDVDNEDVRILERQIELLKPKIIVVMSTYARVAMSNICTDALMICMPAPSHLVKFGTYTKVMIDVRTTLNTHLLKHETKKSI